MRDFTDYHQYSWTAIKPSPSPLITFLFRLPFYLLIIIVIHFSYTTKFYPQVDASAKILVFSIISFLTFLLIFILHLFLNHLSAIQGSPLIHYQINKQGIFINDRHYPHTSSITLYYPDSATTQRAKSALSHYLSH